MGVSALWIVPLAYSSRCGVSARYIAAATRSWNRGAIVITTLTRKCNHRAHEPVLSRTWAAHCCAGWWCQRTGRAVGQCRTTDVAAGWHETPSEARSATSRASRDGRQSTSAARSGCSARISMSMKCFPEECVIRQQKTIIATYFLLARSLPVWNL